MTVKAFVILLLGGVLVNNLAFEKLLGIVPVLGGTAEQKKALNTGWASCIAIVLTALLAYPVETCLLGKVLPAGLRVLVYAAVALIVVYAMQAALKKYFGQYLPMIALNSAVIGCAVNNAAAGYGFAEAMAAAIGAGLGFAAAMYVFSGIRGKIREKYVPACFRGLPIYLLAAGIISMALIAYA